jgi:putative transposase
MINGDDPELSVRRQCELMGLASIAPRKRTTAPGDGHRIYPYLLRNLDIDCPNKVWCSDITYIHGYGVVLCILQW